MRVAVAAIPALAITLAQFFLMQLLITPSDRDIPKPVVSGGVRLVTLVRDSATGSVQGEASSFLPPETELAIDIPAPKTHALDALPPLGGPPVAAVKNPIVPAKPKVAQKKSGKQELNKRKSRTKKATKGSRSAQTKASRKDSEKSTGATSGKKSTRKGSGFGGKRSKGRSSKGLNSDGTSGVVVLSQTKPTYPQKALRNKEEGWVKVAFTITEQGTVANPKVVAAKPRRVFDRSVLEALRKWRFEPKTVGGKPVLTKVTQLIEFKLDR
jgi:TonB family protein